MSPSRNRRLQAAEEADVLVVQVDVHEPAQAAAVGDALAQAGVTPVDVGEQFADRGTGALNRFRTAGVVAQDRRDADLDGHEQHSRNRRPGAPAPGEHG